MSEVLPDAPPEVEDGDGDGGEGWVIGSLSVGFHFRSGQAVALARLHRRIEMRHGNSARRPRLPADAEWQGAQRVSPAPKTTLEQWG